MNIFSLFGLIAVIALAVTIVLGLIKKPKNWILYYLQMFLGVFFIFSGIVKAIDPTGTAIKLGDYFAIFTEYIPFLEGLWNFLNGIALPLSIFTIVLEIALGIALILGVLITPTLILYAALMIFFLFLTGFSAYTGKVTDCGCFGDFVKLKPFESFLKDIFLMLLIIPLIIFRKSIFPIFKKPAIGLGLLGLLTLLTLGFNLRNVFDLPIVDFRAYKEGTNLIDCTSDEGLDPGETIVYYTLEQAGKTKKVTSEEYMDKKLWKDTSWALNKEKTETIVVKEPELPPCKDFMVFNENEENIADSLLHLSGYHFFVASYQVEKSQNKCFNKINQTLQDAAKEGIRADGLTASGIPEANQRAKGIYVFNNLDAVPIKTMIRANPGLLLIKDGVIVEKWHHNKVPSWAEIKKKHGIR